MDWFEKIIDCLGANEDEIWTDDEKLLCKTEELAKAVSTTISVLSRAEGEDLSVEVGYCSPEDGEDTRGWWYVAPERKPTNVLLFTKRRRIKFCSLGACDFFYDDEGDLYKTISLGDLTKCGILNVNAVRLKDGTLAFFRSDYTVWEAVLKQKR